MSHLESEIHKSTFVAKGILNDEKAATKTDTKPSGAAAKADVLQQ